MAEASDRRVFLKKSALAVSALATGCGGPEGAGGSPEASRGAPRRFLPDAELLAAVGHVVLPGELGEAGRSEAVSRFQAWLRSYAPVAERVHGYGSQEIRYGPPDPAPRWAAQLEALDLEARARHGDGFAALSAERRRALLERALASAPAGLPGRSGVLEAEHVAAALLAWFYGTPEAVDLCYGRRIEGLSCRPLSESGDIPPPLPGGVASVAGRGAGDPPPDPGPGGLGRPSGRAAAGPAPHPGRASGPAAEPGS